MIPALKQLQESAGTADTGHSSKDMSGTGMEAKELLMTAGSVKLRRLLTQHLRLSGSEYSRVR